MPTGRVILGNQLFPPACFPEKAEESPVFMVEDWGLCTYEKHHKQKIALFLAAMRGHRDELARRGINVTYHELFQGSRAPQDDPPYEDKLKAFVDRHKLEKLRLFEVEDKFFEQRLVDFANTHGLQIVFEPSPMFLTPRSTFADYTASTKGKPLMAAFYKQQRRRLKVLLDEDGNPPGGQWSFDTDNRKTVPKGTMIPTIQPAKLQPHVQDLIPHINEHFFQHPGELSEEDWWLPTTRRQAMAWLRSFLDERFDEFGPYEDALSTRDAFLWHSALTPMLNLGLITPQEVLDRALEHAKDHNTKINSVEGFVRQIIGWREFIRGVYQRFSEQQEQSNFFDHQRRLNQHWYNGTTGIPPLDDVIQKAQRYGYAHHIERLMVVGNLMTLCEIHPQDAHRWFMEMFVDSSDWVMGPNVYGMGLFSDGGLFATKPYICGSNYLLKMSDYKKPKTKASQSVLFEDGDATWCDAVDGLYWRFIDKHRNFFKRNARMGTAVATFDKMAGPRKTRILSAAEALLARITQ